MRIIELRADNLKRLHAVHIKPDGRIVPITGRNGQGKSSVLDAITYALAGKAVQPEQPIRRGAESASVVVDLGDIVVTRTWTGSGHTYLSVESPDGAKFSSPQAVLDKLVGNLTFDPLAFAQMKPADQVETLRRISDLDFSNMDKARATAFEDRAAVNRSLKSGEAQLAATPVIDAPDEEVSLAELTQKHAESRRVASLNDDRRRDHKRYIDYLRDTQERVDSLKKQLQAAESDLADAKQAVEESAEEVAGLVDPDFQELEQQIRTCEQTNAKVRQKKQRAAIAKSVNDLRGQAEELTETIDSIDTEKSNQLAAAKMPIGGLSFNDKGVTFRDIPFEQASSAEQLRISVAVGLALNPKLRVMLIRDGSLLDSESMKLLGELAEASDSQIWVERVSDGEPVGVVIEDGYAKGGGAVDVEQSTIESK